jgi:hypothetical protein
MASSVAKEDQGEAHGFVGHLVPHGPDTVHGWGQHRWHADEVQVFPVAFEIYDDIPRLFRDFVLPGHLPERPLLAVGDTVVTLGSCFAQELREVLEKAQFGSSSFWIPSGLNNTYALLDFVSWATTGSATHRGFRYERSAGGEIVEWQPEAEQAAYQEHFRQAGAFVFTLGLSEVWLDRVTGQVFWRGVPEQVYDEGRHEFRLTTVDENAANIRELIRLVRAASPDAPIVVTLSPVPLLGTFRGMSCMTADCVSKSVLRVAIDTVLSERPAGVYYWPSFELVKWAGPAFDWRVYGQDARHVHRYLVQCIVGAFVEHFYGPDAARLLRDRLHEGGHVVAKPHRLRRGVTESRRFTERARRKALRELGRLAARRASP